MDHIHKRFTAERVNVLLKGYCQGVLNRPAIEETLGISKSTQQELAESHGVTPQHISAIEQENSRLKKLVSDLSLDNAILKDASRESA